MTVPEERDFKKKNYVFDAQERCWTVEDETEYMDLIKYEYPHDAGCTPFSSNPYYHHFAEASGLSYLGSHEDFEKPWANDNILKAIPMGYRTLLILERICLYEQGKVIFDRSKPRTEENKNNYIGSFAVMSSKLQYYDIPSWGSHQLSTCFVKRNNLSKLQIDTIYDIDLAGSIAKDYSIKDKSRCIVCKVIDNVYWH